MKHFFQFSFVIVVLFFLTSCRSMQWTSRRYTPGIFIDHASKIQRTEKSHFNELSSTGFSNAQQFETASIQLTPKLSVKEFSASADYSTASITNFNHSTYSNKEITTRIANSKMLKLNDTKASNQDFLDNRKVSSKSFGLLKNTNPLDEEGMFILLVIVPVETTLQNANAALA